jgi:tetratricopeptide (TPR) repeat protein
VSAQATPDYRSFGWTCRPPRRVPLVEVRTADHHAEVRILPAVLFAASLFLATSPPAVAHDDPESEVVQLSARIAADPGSAALRLERAELFRLGGDWAASLADLQAASSLDPSVAAVDLALARLMLDSANLPAARDAADRFVARSPGNVSGHLVRARVLLRLGAKLEAAASFSRAIELDRELRGGDTSGIQPDDYLDRARALADSGRTAEAVEGLDEGLSTLGHPVTLQLLAIELEEKRGNVEGALARVATLEASARRKEMWMARRGDLLAAAGRSAEAARAYRDTIVAISSLPPRARDNAATADLEASVRARLAALVPAAGVAPAANGDDQ